MLKFHSNVFSSFPRTTRDDPGRSAGVLTGPFKRGRPRWTIAGLCIGVIAALWVIALR